MISGICIFLNVPSHLTSRPASSNALKYGDHKLLKLVVRLRKGSFDALSTVGFLAFAIEHLLMLSDEKRTRIGTSCHTMTDLPIVLVGCLSEIEV